VFKPFDKRIGVTHPRVAAHPKVDCFYVYPTVSDQQTAQATKARDPEVRDIALYQAARYSQLCRVYAPLYRQITVPALNRGDATAAQVRSAERDVAEAFRAYLRHDNHGRGFVLIGHSQGTFHLIQVIRREIDRRPSVRRRLVSAILLGGNVTVRKGSDRGGVFSHVPACRRPSQLGCVIAFSTFDTVPPADTFFGRGSNAFAGAFGQPTGPNFRVLCTNPGALGGGTAKLDSIVPSKPFAPGTLIAAGIAVLQFPLPQASTTFIEGRDAFSGRCATVNGARVLSVTPSPGTPDPKSSPDARWGLHLVDASVAMGELLDVLRTQITAYHARM
jgi:hypothetical protein